MKTAISGLVLLTVLSIATAQYGMRVHRFHTCDNFENCLVREQTRYLTQNGHQKVMKFQQYSREEDPWNELFRMFATYHNVVDSIMEEVSSSFKSMPIVRIPSIDRLSNYAKLNCTPTVLEDTWYRVEEVHCVDTNNENFFAKFMPSSFSTTTTTTTTTPEESTPVTTVSKTSTNTESLKVVAVVLAFCIVAIVVVVVVIIIIVAVVHKTNHQDSGLTEPLVNNRIVVPKNGERSAPSYGTF